MLPFLVTPCLVVAVQPCMERIPIKKKKKKKKKFFVRNPRISWCRSKTIQKAFKNSMKRFMTYYWKPPKISLLDKIQKFPFFGILTDEITDISNIRNLVKFIQYHDHKKGEAHNAFIDSTDLLNF